MEAISLFEPDVLRLIKGNRELLCRNSHDDSNKTAIETFEKDVMNVSSNYELLTYLFLFCKIINLDIILMFKIIVKEK